MTHRVKRQIPEAELAATGATCLRLGVSQDFLKTNRQSGQLRQGIHFVTLPGSTKILWNIPMMRDWLVNGGDCPAHQRAIERYLKTLPSHSDYKTSAA